MPPAAPIRLGLRENLGQFSLLVLVNAFVGGMVGIERAVLPLLAESEFGLASKTAILSFIASFGIVHCQRCRNSSSAAPMRAPSLGSRWRRVWASTGYRQSTQPQPTTSPTMQNTAICLRPGNGTIASTV